MSVMVRFSPQDLTTEKYDEVKRRLDEGGIWPPAGLEYHLCFGEDGQLRISEIWSSDEELQTFARELMPILGEVGVHMAGGPEHHPVYNQERY